MALVLTLTLSVCDMSSSSDDYQYTISSAITYIGDAGFKVNNRTEKIYGLIDAEDGAGIDVGEQRIPVELYIDVNDDWNSMFKDPDEGRQAVIVSNLYVYIHLDDTYITY